MEANLAKKENSINLNGFADNALSLVFAHPDKINYNELKGKNKILHLNFGLHRTRTAKKSSGYSDCLKFNTEAKVIGAGL